VLVVMATLAVGVQQLLLNTDRWVAVVGPLATDPAVQTSMAETAASLTLNALDLQQRVQSLPGPLQSLAAPIEAQLATFVDDQALRLVQSPQFAQLWVDVNRVGHQALVQLLRGQSSAGGAITVSNGEVQLNLVELVPALLQRLQQAAPDVVNSSVPVAVGSGLPSQLTQALVGVVGRQLPPDFGYVTVAQSSGLETAQRAVQFLDQFTLALVVGAIILLIVTVVVTPDRRIAALRLGIGVALGMLLAALVVLAVQNSLVSSLTQSPISGAVEAAISAAIVSLAQGMLLVLLVAVVVAVVAFLLGRDWSHVRQH
jgi:hypothetical protein